MASPDPPNALLPPSALLIHASSSSSTWPSSSPSAPAVAADHVTPNFTASSIHYLEKEGVFLTSMSSTFSAVLSSNSTESPFVFAVIHGQTSSSVWSANPTAPAPNSAFLSLTAAGLSISFPNGSTLWSTPLLPRPVAALRLLDSGNLLLLDEASRSLWQSFEHPTDTLLSSQRLPAGRSLSSTAGDYRLLVTEEDAVLHWAKGDQEYWSFSADQRSIKNFNGAVGYMAADDSGISLFSPSGKRLYQINLPPAMLRILRLDSGGRFRIMGFSGNGSALSDELVVPSGACDLPLSCKPLEVCTTQSVGATCNCPSSFTAAPGDGCSPANSSGVASSSNCGSSSGKLEGDEFPYVSMDSGIGYFAVKFAGPSSSGEDISSCRRLCTGNCSCLGFFYQNSSRSCFLIKNQLGSLFSRTKQETSSKGGDGFIKVLPVPRQPSPDSGGGSSFNPIPALLAPIFAFLLLVLLFTGILWWRRRHQCCLTLDGKTTGRKQSWKSSSGYGFDFDEIVVPGLPKRFTYAELVATTGNFGNWIGSGGFGEVFRGDLPDNSTVAVKRIRGGAASCVHRKREFCTEIAVIGSIHHMNLVGLRGFCAEGRQRLLVYEYMNRGSLDRSLFVPGGSVLEWRERMHIAIGAARGLAYLHSGCDRKIVHCDVKPENILLDSGGGVKISDFGLAKLMSPEQSGLVTTMRGTRGYLAPEWLTNSTVSDRTDVYSYGMVLLEIIRGRKNSSTGWLTAASSNNDYFPTAALQMHERGAYLGLADPRLEGRVTEEEVGRAVRVALCCLHEDPALRPVMSSVAAMLEGAMEGAQPRPEALSFLRRYGRAVPHYGITVAGKVGTGDAGLGTGSAGSSAISCYLISQEVSLVAPR
ncbi:G-type lectin S-receptor-like serine/threonine-protein kinase [Apostasia shenzhenica]|uniref:Receptor-like serine/threonine-protein kinase n=1 Tax=Apostasia shenzhenica TaxID=1088818 RepID=A0A2I0A6S9_9ASPA|nr:G-type lectin S-receptor-like serine/threonine-protein kinase [Apostasia shenzhenica]